MAEPPKKVHAITYPPFPTTPAGIAVLSFKDFEERGISKLAVSGHEVDALSIPTIALPHKHDTDRCKSDARPCIINKYGRAKSTGYDTRGNGTKKMEWWQDWEELDEFGGILGYNPTVSRTERFQKAVQDFNKNRTWPPNHVGVRAVWDQFQTFIGQLDSNQPKNSQKSEEEADEDDDLDDGDDPEEEPQDLSSNSQSKEPEVTKVEEYSDVNEKMAAFLNDPEKRMRIYLSSFMRRQGLHYTERNLSIIPRLLSSFVNYLLRNRVFADKKGDEAFQEARKIADIALVELPLTSKLAKLLPDDLNTALKGAYTLWNPAESCPVGDDVPQHKVPSPQPEPKNEPNDVDNEGASWGNGGTSWGSTIDIDSIDTWGAADTSVWGAELGKDDPVSAWLPPPPPTLFPLLGPTTLPMTHQTGIFEWSVRKIKSISPPVPIPQKQAGDVFDAADVYGSPQAIEADLTQRFWKVELEPWLGWEDGFQEPEGVLPRILEPSRGAVLIQDNVVFEGSLREKVGVEEGKEAEKVVYSPTSGVKPFKPTLDTISILVLPAVGEQLRVGMGLGGTWVQMLRCGDLVGDAVKQAKKGKAKTAGQRFWYLEELMVTLTSYHTV
ncbi:hypothetical protein V5O48_005023 [Marasmius crinis-equi]|uniref:Uncharacterized protein n=1 Tax=Marasmius crinis-equi TaxID=585013 RepID=A0ABR3FNH0_9AGAR